MKWFRKMNETVRLNSILNLSNLSQEAITKRFNEAILKAEIFLFIDEPSVEWYDGEDDIEAAPFECFCFERSSGFLCSLGKIDDMENLDKTKKIYSKLASLCLELTPNEFGFFHLFCKRNLLNDDFDEFSVVYEDNSLCNISYKSSKTMINEYIKLIHSKTEGVEKVKETIKVGPKRNQKKRTIRRVIHIASKKDQANVKSARHIDWSHRFLVRGHWRKVDGIGKNRNGDYCIEGRTFVIPYEKGRGQLIRKIRIVTPS